MGVLLFDKAARDAALQDLIAYVPPDSDRDFRLQYFSQPGNLEEFLTTYLPHAFYYGFQEHHRVELQCLQMRGRLVVVVLPRGFGKTSIADGYTIYNVAYGLDPYIVRFEHDLNTGQRQIHNLVKAFTDNPAMQADFNVRPGKIWRPNKGELSFVNRNPYAKHRDIFVRYVGIQSIARGTTFDFSRMSLAIFNDVVKGRGEAMSPAWNNKVRDIVKVDVGMAGAAHSTGQAMSEIFITTIQAIGDVSDQLANDPLAAVYKLPAVLGEDARVLDFAEFVSSDIPNIRAFIQSIEGTPPHLTGKQVTTDDHQRYCEQQPGYAELFSELTSVWPTTFPMWDFVFEIAAQGSDTFLQERQHITGDTRFQKFRRDWFVPYEELPPGDYNFGMAIDPSGEPKDGTDPMAIVAAAYEKHTGDIYILEVWCQQATPDELVEAAQDMYFRHFLLQGRQATVYLEAIVSAVGFGRGYFRNMAAQKRAAEPDNPKWTEMHLAPEVKQTVKKELRLMAMRPLAEQRKIHVIPGHSRQDLLVEQICNWQGTSTHKNLPIQYKIDAFDALTTLIAQIKNVGRAPVWLAPETISKPARPQPGVRRPGAWQATELD